MAHEIKNLDAVGIVGDVGWHGLGRIIRKGMSAVEAAIELKMLEPIFRRPIFWQDDDGTYHEVDSHVANVQNVSGAHNLLGVVGADYSICQNRELAEFTDALAQTGKVEIETCGTIRNGKRVWFLARGTSFQVGDKDTVWPYVLVSNAHDGTQAIRVTPTTVRVVCSNTLHMVVPGAEHWTERPESAAICIRHCGKIADKLEQAKRALAYYGETLRHNRELFEAMQAKKVSEQQVVQLFADSYANFWEVATPEDLSSMDVKIKETAEHRVERMQKASKLFLDRYADEQKRLKLGGTLWAAFNAMTGFVQHDKIARGTDDADRVARRVESNLFGINAHRTHEVLAHALTLAC
jgi:phage/plasmid-like protein (TIGR03299 family)